MTEDETSGEGRLATELAELLRASTHQIDSGVQITPDEAVVARLHEIISEIGWPTVSKVGSVAASNFAELAKSVKDVETKRRWTTLIQEQPIGDVNPMHVAQFEDGLRALEGRPQLYGSMYQRDEQGEVVPVPIEDPESVDERRTAIGLGTLAEAVEDMRRLSTR